MSGEPGTEVAVKRCLESPAAHPALRLHPAAYTGLCISNR